MSMGIRTRITSRGVISEQVPDQDSAFGVEVTKTGIERKTVSVLTGSSAYTGSLGSINLIQSGTHPSVVFVLPAITAGDIGSELRILSEGEGWAQLTLSGAANPIVGNSWEYIVSASTVGNHQDHVLSLSGTNGYYWHILSSTGSFAGVQA